MILELLHAAARGVFPPEDGRTEVVGAVAGAGAAVLSFTAHHVVAADVPAEEVLAHMDPGNLNGPVAPPVLAWLSAQTGLRAGSLDVVLARAPERAVGPGVRVREVEPDDHPRIARARRWRNDLRVFAGDGGMVVLGRGLAGRLELPSRCGSSSTARSGIMPRDVIQLGALRPRAAGRVADGAGRDAGPPAAP